MLCCSGRLAGSVWVGHLRLSMAFAYQLQTHNASHDDCRKDGVNDAEPTDLSPEQLRWASHELPSHAAVCVIVAAPFQ